MNLFAEETQVLDHIPPASYDTAQSSAWVSVAGHERVAAMIHVGAIATTGTLDAKLRVATDASGTGAVDLSGKAITQLADDKDDVVLLIEAKADEMSSYTHLQLVVTPATAASIVGAVVLGVSAHHAPVSATFEEAVS